MIFYHGTTRQNLTEIKKEGALNGTTYLTPHPEEAACYGEVVLEIEYEPLDPKEIDRNNYVKGCWQFRVYNPISVSQIRRELFFSKAIQFFFEEQLTFGEAK